MGGSHDDPPPAAEMIATEEELVKNRVPLEFRDYCAHMLIPLNKCRNKTFSMPFRCVDERHAYEKCQYDHYMRRVQSMKEEVKAARDAQRASEDATLE